MTYLRRKLRYAYLRLRRLKGDPRKIAWGMAMGIFIGITPTMPFHMILAVALAHLFRISRIAAFMGVWIVNPLIMPLCYFLSFKIGKWLLFPNYFFQLPSSFDLQELLRLGWEVNLALQVGGVILALPFGVAAYFITYWAVNRYRQQKPSIDNRALHFSQNSLPPSQLDA